MILKNSGTLIFPNVKYKSTYVALQVNSITHHDSIIVLNKGRHIWIKGYDCDVIIWSIKISSRNQWGNTLHKPDETQTCFQKIKNNKIIDW